MSKTLSLFWFPLFLCGTIVAFQQSYYRCFAVAFNHLLCLCVLCWCSNALLAHCCARIWNKKCSVCKLNSVFMISNCLFYSFDRNICRFMAMREKLFFLSEVQRVAVSDISCWVLEKMLVLAKKPDLPAMPCHAASILKKFRFKIFFCDLQSNTGLLPSLLFYSASSCCCCCHLSASSLLSLSVWQSAVSFSDPDPARLGLLMSL